MTKAESYAVLGLIQQAIAAAHNDRNPQKQEAIMSPLKRAEDILYRNNSRMRPLSPALEKQVQKLIAAKEAQ